MVQSLTIRSGFPKDPDEDGQAMNIGRGAAGSALTVFICA